MEHLKDLLIRNMKEVTEFIEIVFERVQLEKIVGLLLRILANSTLKEYSVSTDSSEINLQSKKTLFTSIEQSSDGSFYFNFLDYSLKDILLSSVGFQIIKYYNVYDLILSIDEREIREKVSILDLQERVASLAEELEASRYYCGYEPAMDEETRIFSGVSLGPLKDWGSMDR